MGIVGLLPIIKPILQRKLISTFKNKRLGIDGHSWLYQVAPSISQEIFFDIPVTRHISLILNKIKSLQQYKIIPIMVFDGSPLPSKEHTNEERKDKKDKIKEEVLECLKNNNISRARELMKRCVSINNKLLKGVIDCLKKENIECIISPYESDAQLCYLQRIGYIDGIMGEDSDFIPYGCTNILFKYDGRHACFYEKEFLKTVKDEFFSEKILQISILSGCDYLQSIHGIGLLTAYKLLKKNETVEKVIEELKIKKNVPSNYLEEFKRAELTFHRQIVFDPIKKYRIHLNGEERKSNELSGFFGSFMDKEEEVQFSKGLLLDGGNKRPFDDFIVKSSPAKRENKIVINTSKRLSVSKKVEVKEPIVDENVYSPYFKK